MDEHCIFHHLLIPTDGSEASIKAAELGFRLARMCTAKVTVVYVMDTSLMDELTRFSEREHEDVRAELRESGWRYVDYLEELARNYHLSVEKVVLEGEPYKEIVDLAQRNDVDLIVMGHVGRRGPRRILVGSVTERVIEFAHCPVLVVKS